MIFVLALTFLALPQETVVQDPKPQTQQEAQHWWEGLSEQEQKQYLERMERYRQLQPTMQEELGRRHDLLREERKRIKKNLSAEELEQFEALTGPERRVFLDQRAQMAFRQRGERLESQFPGAEALRQQPGMEERFHSASRLMQEQRAPQVREAVKKAVADGWIGAVAGKWLETAPLDEAMSALMEVRKWQFLQQAAEKGLWKEMGFDERQQNDIKMLPATEFFHAIRGNREGRGRRHGFGRGGFGGPGQGGPGQGGPRQGGPGPGQRGFGPGPGGPPGFGPGGEIPDNPPDELKGGKKQGKGRKFGGPGPPGGQRHPGKLPGQAKQGPEDRPNDHSKQGGVQRP